MRAYVYDELKAPGGIREYPKPACGPDEVLVRVDVAGVNPVDWKIRAGMSGPRETPMVAGQDVAGVAMAVGENVTRLREGDRVVACARAHGGYAEFTVVGQAVVGEPIATLPDGVTNEIAATLPTPGLTALGNLDALDVGRGTPVLILGAAGSVGRIAVQLARERGAEIIATIAGSGGDDVKRFGAAHIIDSRDVEDVVHRVKALYPDGLPAVLDVVNDGAGLKKLAAILSPGAKILTVIHVADEPWFAQRGFTAINFALGTSPVATERGLDFLTGAIVTGKLEIRAPIERSFDDARAVLDGSASHELKGKYVLEIG